jgi:hypothetical protein
VSAVSATPSASLALLDLGVDAAGHYLLEQLPTSSTPTQKSLQTLSF